MKVLGFDIGVKNLAYCVMSVQGVCQWNVLDVKGKDFNQTSENLIGFLHDEFPELDFEAVLIENQPVMKNPVMKSIQMLIYSYFKILKYQTGAACEIKLVSASTKLNVTLNKDIKAKLTYKEKKNLAVELARKYLKTSDWLSQFEAHKKKDDISDALLYCVNYLESKGVLKASC